MVLPKITNRYTFSLGCPLVNIGIKGFEMLILLGCCNNAFCFKPLGKLFIDSDPLCFITNSISGAFIPTGCHFLCSFLCILFPHLFSSEMTLGLVKMVIKLVLRNGVLEASFRHFFWTDKCIGNLFNNNRYSYLPFNCQHHLWTSIMFIAFYSWKIYY